MLLEYEGKTCTNVTLLDCVYIYIYIVSCIFYYYSIIGVSPKVRKILQLLRLRQINNGVFIRLNKATFNMLQLVEPFIAWGLV